MPTPLPPDFIQWPLAQQRKHLESLPPEALFDVLGTQLDEFNAMLDEWPNLILDGLDARLPTDTASQVAAAAVLARMKKA